MRGIITCGAREPRCFWVGANSEQRAWWLRAKRNRHVCAKLFNDSPRYCSGPAVRGEDARLFYTPPHPPHPAATTNDFKTIARNRVLNYLYCAHRMRRRTHSNRRYWCVCFFFWGLLICSVTKCARSRLLCLGQRVRVAVHARAGRSDGQLSQRLALPIRFPSEATVFCRSGDVSVCVCGGAAINKPAT